MKDEVFIVDDDSSIRDSLGQMLELRNYKVRCFGKAEELLACSDLAKASCYIIDIRMPGMSGLELLQKLIEENLPGPVIVITGHGDVATAVAAIKSGAYDFWQKPFEKQTVLASVARAVEKTRLVIETKNLKKQISEQNKSNDYGLIGKSQAIKEVVKQMKDYALSPSSLLIYGETGTGKELVARGIHQLSGRKGNMVAVNVAALAESMMHAELFGYEKGSFTGATSAYKGKFEYANHGTILLDEIDSMPLHLQPVLLRVIEEKQFTRIGSNSGISINVRVLAATNRDIKSLINENGFRLDLFHRLNTLSIYIPSLRERKEDIPLLVDHFLQQYCSYYERPFINIERNILTAMQNYSWPGNVRELKNCVESMVLRCPDNIITEWSNPEKEMVVAESNTRPLKTMVDDFEREIISETLAQLKGNLKTAAGILDIAPRTLFDKMKKLGLKKEEYK